jgi:putative colanic acid biosynthesis glycosyltransferase
MISDSSIKISVITVVFNDKEGIMNTINSVLNQSYKHIEYLVIDGASADGTKVLIDERKEELNYYISEPDDGLYYAMNKGISKATGDFCLFLNSGDVFYRNNVIEKYVSHIDNLEKLYFSTVIMTDQKTIFRLRPHIGTNIEQWLKEGNLPNHQTMLFPRSYYQNNRYDIRFKYGSDDDYKIRAIKSYPIKFVDIWLVLFSLGGISRSIDSLSLINRRIKEQKMIAKKHGDYNNKSKIQSFKYKLKLYVIWFLNKIFDDKINYEMVFNKFNKIPLNELDKFVIKDSKE